MDRHGSSYRNNFSQASSSAAPSIRSSAAGHDDEDYGIFSQETSYPLTAPSLSTPRVALQNLDLNSYANNFPHIASYSELLESDVPRLPPLPPRSGHGPVQPPRQGAGGRGPGRGGPGRGAQGRRSYSNTRGAAGRGTLMPNRLGHGSSSAGNFFPPQDLDAHNQWEQADDNSSQLEHNEEEEEAWIQQYVLRCHKRRRNIAALGAVFGMFHFETYMNKEEYRVPRESGYQWVMRCLGHAKFCYNMFRMNRDVFDRLHNVLVERYELKSTRKMPSVEALGLFLWMCGAPQGMRQAEERFCRSTETCSRKFDKVMRSVNKLAADIIRPRDPEFRTMHQRLQSARFTPYFDKCIGALDGTHVPVVVPSKMLVQHTGRHNCTTQNVLAVCDFDMRFTFVVAGWPGSVHDMRVFNDAIGKYRDKFPHPPEGMFYLVDSGYPNRPGYLAPYRGTKYHLPEYRQGTMPRGKKELFNFAHSSLHNVIERSFGVLKMKWRILLSLSSYPMEKQSLIIMACMAIHNYIRDSALADEEFDSCDRDENYMPMAENRHRQRVTHHADEDEEMNQFREWIADGLLSRS